MSLENLLTVRQVVERCPAITEGGLRWWLFNAETNGLAKAVVRAGGRVYIDIAAFDRWFRRQDVDECFEASDAEENGGEK